MQPTLHPANPSQHDIRSPPIHAAIHHNISIRLQQIIPSCKYIQTFRCLSKKPCTKSSPSLREGRQKEENKSIANRKSLYNSIVSFKDMIYPGPCRITPPFRSMLCENAINTLEDFCYCLNRLLVEQNVCSRSSRLGRRDRLGFLRARVRLFLRLRRKSESVSVGWDE